MPGLRFAVSVAHQTPADVCSSEAGAGREGKRQAGLGERSVKMAVAAAEMVPSPGRMCRTGGREDQGWSPEEHERTGARGRVEEVSAVAQKPAQRSTRQEGHCLDLVKGGGHSKGRKGSTLGWSRKIWGNS